MRVDHVYPPIPIRSSDWCATLDEYDGAPDAGRQIVGQGATRQEAIDALIDDIIDAYECTGDRETFERRMLEVGIVPPDHSDPLPATLQECACCQGEGRIYRRQGSLRPWETDDTIDCGPCEVCSGTGEALEPTQPVTEAEIMEGANEPRP